MLVKPKANVFINPMEPKYLNFNSYIYIFYKQSNISYNLAHIPAWFPYKMIYSICKEGNGTASQRNTCTQHHENT